MITTKKFLMQHCCSLVLYSHDRNSLRFVYSLCKRKYCNGHLCSFVVFHRLLCQDMLAVNTAVKMSILIMNKSKVDYIYISFGRLTFS